MISRRPVPAELVLFARVLANRPRRDRRSDAQRLLQEVSEANAFRLSTGRSHPEYGDGSLISRLMKQPIPALGYADDRDFLLSMLIVVVAVLNHNVSNAMTLTCG